MTLTVTMQNALSALQASQAALNVVSTNIANVNTEGYSRKTVAFSPQVLDGQAQGVEIAAIERQVDEYVRTSLRSQTSQVGYSSTELAYFDRMQQLFGAPGDDSSLGPAVTRLASELENLALSPEAAASTFSVANAAQALAAKLNGMAEDVQALRRQADQQLAAGIARTDELLKEIAALNGEIVSLTARGQPSDDLMDRRDLALSRLSGLMEVKSFAAEDGALNIYSVDGRQLVSGSSATPLSYTAAGTMNALVEYPASLGPIALGAGDPPPPGSDITGSLGTGELKALVEMRDRRLPALASELDALAAALRTELNLVHNRGANTPFGRGATGADPATLTGSRAFSDAGAGVTLASSVALAVLDESGREVAGLLLPAGATSVEGLRASIDGLLAGSPAGGSATFNADGRLEIRLGAGYRLALLDQGAAADGGDSPVSFGGSTYRGLSNFLGLNDLFVTPALGSGLPVTEGQGDATGIAGSFALREDIAGDPALLSRGRLRGVPGSLTLGAGDNAVALELAARMTERIEFPAVAGGQPASSASLADYANGILAFNATAAAAAADRAEQASALESALRAKSESVSGVNLEEELANLVIFQNAYAAAARTLQAAKEMYDVLLAI